MLKATLYSRQKLEERKRKKAIEAGQVASDSKGNLADSPAYEATARLLEPKEAPPAYHQVVKQG